MASIRIEHVRKSYGDVTVVKDFSLDVADGEFVVLVGPSGCGKSTMLKIVAGLEEASAGQVHIGARDVTDLAPGDRDIAMVFQNYALYPHLSVRKNMAFGLRMRGMDKQAIERRVAAAAKILGLDDLLDHRAHQLRIVAFGHDADQRFGAGLAHQHATACTELALGRRDRRRQ